MNNQKDHWNKIFEDIHLEAPSTFSSEVLHFLKPNSKVLEIGCGAGNDSIAFAKAGHKILATDFSEVVIRKNQERFKNNENLSFEILDISKPMAFKDKSFDAIYSRLSLHYFTDDVTRKILKELHRILKPNGQLYFVCKSTDDPLYGEGEKIEEDIFERKGHIRHFFSEAYTRECLDGLFKIEELEKGTDNFYDRDSAFIKVIANKL